jgi:hypothetical protein
MPAEHPHWTVRSNMDIIPIDTPVLYLILWCYDISTI